MSQLLQRRRHRSSGAAEPFTVFDQGLGIFHSPMLGMLPSALETMGIGQSEFLDIDIDVYEKNDDVVVDALLPGVTRDDLDVTVVDDVLTIRAERQREDVKNEHNYFRKELIYGSLLRTIPLPVAVDEDRVTATFRDGMLTIHAPKADVAGQARSVPID